MKIRKLLVTFFILLNLSSWAQNSNISSDKEAYLRLTEELLTRWTNAMVDHQIDQPSKPKVNGALACPASSKIHGRCMDAVYPFMYMANRTGEKKFLNAAIEVMNWSKNVTSPDGSWTVIPDPKSWKGITIFGAIALANAIKYHGAILPVNIRNEWTSRLRQAAEFIYSEFKMDYSHINYGFTAVHGLHLLGEVLKDDRYTQRSHELAQEIPKWFTSENTLLYGEDKPSNKTSAKGLLPIDLGYNVEESLNGVVLYALAENDKELLDLLTKSLKSHLEFMLPDGGWDNSWGSRQNKWTYWGSRTTDGSQIAYLFMADRHPSFAKAAFQNTLLLQKSTVDNLLSGGLHYESHGIKPCIHHTFAHAKTLAYILDNRENIPAFDLNESLPRSKSYAIKHFSDLDVFLGANEEWKYTVSCYDNIFKTKGSNQASGGALAMLYSVKVGPVFAASMVKYMLAEKNNQQDQPGEEFATTPRIEAFEDNEWYTNLYDLQSQAKIITNEPELLEVKTRLRNSDRIALDETLTFTIRYQTDGGKFKIKINNPPQAASFVLPIISPQNEDYRLLNPNTLEIEKGNQILRLSSNLELKIKESNSKRIFNMVPGVEVIPILVDFEKGQNLELYIEVL